GGRARRRRRGRGTGRWRPRGGHRRADGRRLMGRLHAALLGVTAAGAATAVLGRRPPGGPGRWQRTNYADRTGSLPGGVAQAAGTTPARPRARRTGAAPDRAAGTGER